MAKMSSLVHSFHARARRGAGACATLAAGKGNINTPRKDSWGSGGSIIFTCIQVRACAGVVFLVPKPGDLGERGAIGVQAFLHSFCL